MKWSMGMRRVRGFPQNFKAMKMLPPQLMYPNLDTSLNKFNNVHCNIKKFLDPKPIITEKVWKKVPYLIVGYSKLHLTIGILKYIQFSMKRGEKWVMTYKNEKFLHYDKCSYLGYSRIWKSS